MTSLQTSPFYNATSTLTDAWYAQPHRTVRRKFYRTQPVSLDEHKGKQEAVCAVILALSLLFAFVECLAGFAVS